MSGVGVGTVFLPQNVDDFHGNRGRNLLHARDVLKQVKGDFCEMTLCQIEPTLLTNDVNESVLFDRGELVHWSPLVAEVRGPSLRIERGTTGQCWIRLYF